MKKMKNVWVGLLLAFIMVPFIQSCLDDNNDYPYPWMDADKGAIATIHAIDGKEVFYFLLDGDKKLYPGDLSRISSAYKWKDGQRVAVYFNLLKEEVAGYDYNGEIVYIDNILTKDIIPLTEETADSIGDDRIDISQVTYSTNYVNIAFTFIGSENPKDLHMINLVRNEIEGAEEDDDYLVVEFRHNAYDDPGRKTLTGFASFKLALTEEEAEKYKGLKIRTNTIYGGIKYEKYDFNEKEKNGTTTTKGSTTVR